jgi:hypothetical protein
MVIHHVDTYTPCLQTPSQSTYNYDSESRMTIGAPRTELSPHLNMLDYLHAKPSFTDHRDRHS